MQHHEGVISASGTSRSREWCYAIDPSKTAHDHHVRCFGDDRTDRPSHRTIGRERLLYQSRPRRALVQHQRIDRRSRQPIARFEFACFQQCHAGSRRWILLHTQCFTAGGPWCATYRQRSPVAAPSAGSRWARSPMAQACWSPTTTSGNSARSSRFSALASPTRSSSAPRTTRSSTCGSIIRSALSSEPVSMSCSPTDGALSSLSARSSSPPTPVATHRLSHLGGAPISAHVSFNPLVLFSGITYRF